MWVEYGRRIAHYTSECCLRLNGYENFLRKYKEVHIACFQHVTI